MSDARTEAKLAALERKVAELERRLAPVENQRVAAQSAPVLGCIVDGFGDPRTYQIAQQKVSDDDPDRVNVHTPINLGTVYMMDRDGRPQNYSQDALILELEHFRVLCPQPGRIVPVLDRGGGAAWPDRLGRWADVNTDGVPTAPDVEDEIPMLPAQNAAQYHESAVPWRFGNIYPGFRCFPLPDHPITGVDPDKGFWIVFLDSFGDEAKVITEAVVLASGETLTAELKLDGAGRVRSFTFVKTGP